MMRISSFDHSFFSPLLISLVLISGCGGGMKGKNSTSFDLAAQMQEVRDLGQDERTIATRICYAYKSKNTSFKTVLYLNGVFNFLVSDRDCLQQYNNYEIKAELKSFDTGLLYSTTDPRQFEKKVQTSSSGFLTQLCTKIQNNLPISNTLFSDDVKVQVRFFLNGQDSYSLSYFAADSKIESMETFKVRTQFNLTGNQILGMDEEYSRQKVCPLKAGQFSSFNQTFTSFKKN